MKFVPIAFLLAAGCISLAHVAAQVAAQGPTPNASAQGGSDPGAFQISVDVALVALEATVRDHEGHAVARLRREDFAVFEDGRAQEIRLFRHEDTPVAVGLVVDHSGSMKEKLDEVTAGARAFVQASNSRDQMFVVNFNEKVSQGLPPGMRFSDNVEQLAAAVSGRPAVGTTALYDAIIDGLTRLRDGVREKKVLIVISDGGDNASKAHLDRVLKMAEQSNAMIYTIGIFEPDDLDGKPAVLRRLARETGGQAFFPSQLAETVEICEHIAKDIRDQYTIGYSSANEKHDGTYHKIRLIARSREDGRLSVRTRAGYTSMESAPATSGVAAK